MTAAEFIATYLATAQEVSAGTGIEPYALLAQWANETDWGTAWLGAPCNLANIRNGPGGSIVTYGSLSDFVQACIATWQNGYYAAVLGAVGVEAQLAAIVASPWSAGHYGGSLESFYLPLEANMDQATFNALVAGSPLANLSGGVTSTYQAIITAQKAIIAAVQAINVAGGGLTPAQAQELQDAHDALLREEAAFKAA